MRRSATLAALLLLAGAAFVFVHPQPIEKNPAPVTALMGAFIEELALLEEDLAGAREQELLGIRFVLGELKGRRVVLVSSGVGKVNAAMSATLLIDHFRPSEVIFTGIAGAINPELEPGDIVIGARTAQHDLGTLTSKGMQLRGMRNPITWERNPVFLDADPGLMALAESAAKGIELAGIEGIKGAKKPRILKGAIASGDVFVASPAKREELRATLKADAVDMEGGAVAQVCFELGVPCLVIRSISDTAGENAREQSNVFYAVAAANSAALVEDIVARLAAAEGRH